MNEFEQSNEADPVVPAPLVCGIVKPLGASALLLSVLALIIFGAFPSGAHAAKLLNVVIGYPSSLPFSFSVFPAASPLHASIRRPMLSFRTNRQRREALASCSIVFVTPGAGKSGKACCRFGRAQRHCFKSNFFHRPRAIGPTLTGRALSSQLQEV